MTTLGIHLENETKMGEQGEEYERLSGEGERLSRFLPPDPYFYLLFFDCAFCFSFSYTRHNCFLCLSHF